MKEINTKSILNFIESEGYKYTLKGVAFSESYFTASIFKIISNGFYYLTSNSLIGSINSSLILINKLPSQLNNNTFIVLENNVDVQVVYYKLLKHFFSVTSTGSIHNTAIIDNGVQLGKNVQVGKYSIIESCNIGNNVIIGDYVKIQKDVVIQDNVRIDDASIIGASGIAWVRDEIENNRILQPQLGGVLIETDCVLGANTVIVRGSLSESTKIGSGSVIAPGCRLGHGTILGRFVHLANNVITGGNTVIGDESFVGSASVFRPKVQIESNTIVGAGSVVVKNSSEKGLTLMGVPAKEYKSKKYPKGMPKPKL